MDWPVPWQRWQGTAVITWPRMDWRTRRSSPAPWHSGHAVDRGARRGARALAGVAVDGDGHVDLALDPEDGLAERELDDQLGVGARHRPGAPTPGLGAAHAVEEGVEEVAEPTGAERVAARTVPGGLAEHPGVAEAVVAGPPLGIPQDLVGQADLLEVLVVLAAGLVGVRVELAGLGPVGALQLLVGGVAADAEELVEVGVGHRAASPRRSPSRSPTTRAAARASG